MQPRIDNDLPTYESLCAGAGYEWFGESWTIVARWLEALSGSGAQDGHKIWGLIGLLSLLTANLRLNVESERVGVRRMNLATLMLGEQTAQIRSIIRTVQSITEQSGITLLPSDTGGNRLHLIRAMLGYDDGKKGAGASAAAKTESSKATLSRELLAILAAHGNRPTALAMPASLTEAPANVTAFATASSDAIPPVGNDKGTDADNRLLPRAMISGNLQSLVHGAYNDMTLLLAQCVAGEKLYIQTDHAYRVNDSALSIFAGCYFQGLVTRDGYVNADFLSQILPVYCSSYVKDDGWEANRKAITSFGESCAALHAEAVPRHTYKLADSAKATFARLSNFKLKTQELALSGYANHRPLTMAKIAGMLCFARRGHEIRNSDVNLAHMLLLLNETTIEVCCIALHAQGTEARVWLALIELIDKIGNVRTDEAMRYVVDRARISTRDAAAIIETLVGMDRISIDARTGTLQLATTSAELGLTAFKMQLDLSKGGQSAKLDRPAHGA